VGTGSSFVHILEMFDLFPVINLYSVIGENTLANHPSDGFLHIFILFWKREIWREKNYLAKE
jgi:hypothetical protein